MRSARSEDIKRRLPLICWPSDLALFIVTRLIGQKAELGAKIWVFGEFLLQRVPLPEQAFWMVGGIEEAVEKAKAMAAA